MLKSLRDLIKDSFTYGASSLAGQIIGFLLLPLYTSYLSTVDYGIMAMLAILTSLFPIVSSLGLTNAVFRRFNLHLDPKVQQDSLSTAYTSILIISILLLLISLFFHDYLSVIMVDDSSYKNLVIISLFSGFIGSVLAVLNVILRAKRKVVQLSVFRIIQLIITIITTIFLVVFKEQGVSGVIYGTFYGYLLTFIIQHLYFFKLIKIKIDLSELKELLNYGFPFFPHRILTYSSVFIIQFLIKEFIGLSESGLYNIALRFTLPLAFVVTAIQSAWVPIKFQIHRENPRKSSDILSKMMNIYFIFISLSCSILLLLGPEILRFMTSIEFHEAANFLPFVILIPFFRGIYHVMGTGFEITKNTKPMPLVSGTGLIIIIITSIALSNYIGIYGLIISVILSWIVQAILLRGFSVRRFYVKINYKMLLRFILTLIISSILIFVVQNFKIDYRIMAQIMIFLMSVSIISIYSIFFIQKEFKSIYGYNDKLDYIISKFRSVKNKL